MQIRLRFSDPEAAGELVASDHPQDVLVSGPSELIEASEPAEIFSVVVIEFAKVSSGLLAAWIISAIRKRHRASTRINRKEIPLTEEAVKRLIDEQLASREARLAAEQLPDDHKA